MGRGLLEILELLLLAGLGSVQSKEPMTQTEKMIREMNGFFKQIGDAELPIPTSGERGSELEMLRQVKEEYTKRLINKIPIYKAIPVDIIPDMFLEALRNRERELLSGAGSPIIPGRKDHAKP
jgi:hypothetical protein